MKVVSIRPLTCFACFFMFATLCLQLGCSPQKPIMMQKVSFSPDRSTTAKRSIGKITNYRISLMEPDNPEQPKAWLGPLIVTDQRSGKSCKMDIELITDVYDVNSGSMFLVFSYGGSSRYINYIDPRSCRHMHPELELYTEGIVVTNNRIIVKPGCECAEEYCRCSAGLVIEINKNYEPIILEKGSLELTKKIVGVAFKGSRKVRNPKTPNAELLPD